MQSSAAEHFFETDASQLQRQRRSAKASNPYGHPVVLKAKIVAVLPDPTAPSYVFVAEATGTVRRVNVDDGSVSTVFRGPTAPATCLALGGPGNSLLFVGSWDKMVYAFPVDNDGSDSSSRSVAPLQTFSGHSDFVKAVVCGQLCGKDVLISGGADRRILVWDVATGQRLHALHDHGGAASAGAGRHAGRAAMLAVQALAIDPVTTTADEIRLVSASSDPHIRQWWVRLDGSGRLAEADGGENGAGDSSDDKTPDRLRMAVAVAATTPARTLLAHETTVYRVVFDTSDDDVEQGVDLWTASGDGTARCLARRLGFRQKPQRPGDGPTTLQHGDHVRALALTDAWVVTAGRDEDVKFWDRTGADDDDDDDDKGRSSNAGVACTATITGHYDEVTDLAVLADGRRLCSVSLDGTVRTWPLARSELDALVRQQRADRDKAAAAGAGGDTGDAEGEGAGAAGMLTAEEDAELAALMDD